MDLMSKSPHSLCHQRLKVFSVIIRKENALTAVAAQHHMVKRTWNMQARFPSHESTLTLL
jgi:hypothetical protein